MLRRGFITGKGGTGFGVEGVTCRASREVLAYCWPGQGQGEGDIRIFSCKVDGLEVLVEM